jgi:hypothetical protein
MGQGGHTPLNARFTGLSPYKMGLSRGLSLKFPDEYATTYFSSEKFVKSMVSRGLSPENAEEKYSYVQCLASTAQLIMIQYAMTKTAMSESSGCGKLSCLWRGAILAIVL